jgi:DNA-binding CsgD family transcriptional regulator
MVDCEVGTVVITERESQYLLWALRGKTAWETAAILGTSENTAAKMLRSATAKLGVANKRMAAIKALQLGLLPDVGGEFADLTTAQTANKDRPLKDMSRNGESVSEWPFVNLPFALLRALAFRPTSLCMRSEPHCDKGSVQLVSVAGVALWSAQSDLGRIGLQWSWTVIDGGVVVIDDPLAIVTNAVLSDGPFAQSSPRPQALIATMVSRLPWHQWVAEETGAARSNRPDVVSAS